MPRNRRTIEGWQTGRRMTLALLMLSLTAAGPAPGEDRPGGATGTKERAAEVQERIAAELNHLETLYKHLHTNPELSLQEARTAARLARELKEIGFEMTENVGGHGLVGILRNGEGPTVLVRTDMDALPVIEQTGLPYPARSACGTKTRTRSASCMRAGMICI